MSTKKSHQLGMPFGTASNRLRKIILFNLVQKLNLNICFHCKKKISKIEELSIEHKIPWLDNDIKLFWDINNIAFSHHKCNISVKRRPERTAKRFKNNLWLCKDCNKYLPEDKFSKTTVNKKKIPKLYCKVCRAKRRREGKNI